MTSNHPLSRRSRCRLLTLIPRRRQHVHPDCHEFSTAHRRGARPHARLVITGAATCLCFGCARRDGGRTLYAACADAEIYESIERLQKPVIVRERFFGRRRPVLQLCAISRRQAKTRSSGRSGDDWTSTRLVGGARGISRPRRKDARDVFLNRTPRVKPSISPHNKVVPDDQLESETRQANALPSAALLRGRR